MRLWIWWVVFELIVSDADFFFCFIVNILMVFWGCVICGKRCWGIDEISCFVRRWVYVWCYVEVFFGVFRCCLKTSWFIFVGLIVFWSFFGVTFCWWGWAVAVSRVFRVWSRILAFWMCFRLFLRRVTGFRILRWDVVF